MLTNADIGLTRYFYTHILPNLSSREAFSINRLTIPLNTINITSDADSLLLQVDLALGKGTKHPGHDCFVMHSSVLKRIHMGDLFAGYPPWGSALHAALKIMAHNFTSFESNVNGTFHLGNDGSRWKKTKNNSTPPEIENMQHFLEHCPSRLFSGHPYTLLNTINCGKWFAPSRLFANHTIPNFVLPGSEQIYLKNS
jgi:hypothetical protein